MQGNLMTREQLISIAEAGPVYARAGRIEQAGDIVKLPGRYYAS
jgi:hypothetical protein